MKLLLTSSGVGKRAIAAALQDMVGKAPGETKIGYIPIAANAEEGNKDWFINQFLNFWRFGYSWIDIVDPTANEVDWKRRLSEVDVIFMSGGNTFHLLDQLRKTSFDTWLNNNLNSKVYVGVSAGTIVATPTIEVAGLPPGDPNLPGLEDLTGLNWVDFEIEPHCDMGRFDKVEQYAKTRPNPVYAIDDQTAIKVDGDKVEVISEGTWKLYDKTIEERLAAIEARNSRVENDKAWETSWTRRLSITGLTYAVVACYLVAIGNDEPFVNAAVPAAGFLLSTMVMKQIRTLWQR